MVIYLSKFLIVDREQVIANTYNNRQDLLAEHVIRGDIISVDGEVLATNELDDQGNLHRIYPHGNMFAHAIGYSTKGKAGIELLSNYYLLNSNSNIVEQIKNNLAQEKNQGDTVVTTLDYRIQSAAYEALGEGKGAVVVMEPDTGRILAMVSKPDYNPNQINGIMEDLANEQLQDNTILLNRATQGLYPPGSTFKVLTTLEYIRENKGYENYHYECQGEAIFNSVNIHCYNSTVHGGESLADSLAYSCNTSYANMGTTLDMDSYQKLCEDFCFNTTLPYNGIYKKSSFVLSSTSDKSAIPQTVIGQGDTLITPLHNALIMATIANGGVMMKPQLMHHIENDRGIVVREYKPEAYKRIISAHEAQELSDLLQGVVTYGTGNPLQNELYTVAGKTGTAEYDSQGNSHSWFVGFSNVDQPDLVVCVLVEEADQSGIRAVSVARRIFDAYYQ